MFYVDVIGIPFMLFYAWETATGRFVPGRWMVAALWGVLALDCIGSALRHWPY